VAVANYLSHTLIGFAVPLYFRALEFPNDSWETFLYYALIGFVAGSGISGPLAVRCGEQRMWATALAIRGFLGFLLLFLPGSHWVIACGLIFGLVSAVEWVGAICMAQVVPVDSIGKANSSLLVASSLGSITGPVVGRLLLSWSSVSAVPSSQDFALIFLLQIGLTLVSSLLVWTQIRHPGSVLPAPLSIGIREQFKLLRLPKYLAMVVPLSVMAGPVFQTVNIYIFYRASDPEIGLIVASADHGWSALLTLS
jgi:MFS family permease